MKIFLLLRLLNIITRSVGRWVGGLMVDGRLVGGRWVGGRWI